VKKLKYGQVGGGVGAFIGPVHRAAVSLTGKAELVAGCFSSDHERNIESAKKLGIDPSRVYRTFEEMAEKEAKREDKIDFVSIVVPNYLHFEVAKSFLENGINVVCDKPLTLEIKDAFELVNLVKSTNLEFMVTYTYIGYSMIKKAKEIIKSGEIGKIKFVVAEYPQEWLLNKRTIGEGTSWRLKKEYMGVSSSVGDIGAHIESLVSFLTDLKVKRILAKLSCFIHPEKLDDNAFIILEYDSGAVGNYWTSQIASGNKNALKLRIYGTEGSIEWEQEKPNRLILNKIGEPTKILFRGRETSSKLINSNLTLPMGHPEGFVEAFANLYSSFIEVLLNKKLGKPHPEKNFPDVLDGARGVTFVHTCVESSQRGSIWIDFPKID